MMLRSPTSSSIRLHAIAAVLFGGLLAMPAIATEVRSASPKVAPKWLTVGKKNPFRIVRNSLHHPQANWCDGGQGRQYVLMLGIGY